MASENRPGVIVTQALSENVAISATPTLVPLVMAPCFQIIEATNSDGSLNSSAKHASQYNQASLTIPQANFPDPRSNIDEIDIYEDKVNVQLYKFSGLSQLQRGSNGTAGSSFLQRIKSIYRPAIVFDTGASINFASDVKTLVMAIDTANPGADDKDITYTFTGLMTADQIATSINDRYGSTIAFEDSNKVVVFSPTYGPAGSITIRGDSSALDDFDGTGTYRFLDNAGAAITTDIRVEGSGLAAQDDEDGDLLSPWIEYSRGAAKYSTAIKGTTYTAMNAWPDWAAFNSGTDDTPKLKTGPAPAVTFAGSSPTVPLAKATATTPGDYLVADAIRPSSSEVIAVETSRFKLGTINTSKSTFSSTTGELVTRVYDALEVNILTRALPFSPKYAYFVAQNLVAGSIVPEGEAATLSGTAANILPAKYAQVSGSTGLDTTLQSGGLISAGGLTLVIQETVDGVQKPEVTVAFTGVDKSATDLAGQISGYKDEDAGYTLTCTAAVVGNYFVITSAKTGKDQGISVKASGNANSKLGFSSSSATSAFGKDFECASVASFTTEPFDPTHQNAQTAVIDMIFTDGDGVSHVLSDTLASTPLADINALVTEISGKFDGTGGLLMKYGIAVGKVEAVGTNQLKFSTIDGGADAGLVVSTSEPDIGILEASFKESELSVDVVGDLTAFTLEQSSVTIATINSGLSGSGNTTYTEIAAALNADATFNAATNPDFFAYVKDEGLSTEKVVIVHLNPAKQSAISVTADTGATVTVGAPVAFTNIDESGSDKLKDSSLKFYLDDNPYGYEISKFITNSVSDAVDEINELVGGDVDVASFSTTDGAITLTSTSVGAASDLLIDTASTSYASTHLAFTASSDSGSGRPNPDFYIDSSTNAVMLGPNILRNTSTGIPYSKEATFIDIYIEYTALRKDVTSSAASPGLLSFGSISELEASIGPISQDNPLGLAAYLCLLNSAGSLVSCLGVDESTAAAPLGTVNSYLRALEFAESKEVYAMAPMTDDLFIQKQISTHVQTMSTPSERGERIALFWAATPERAVDTSIEGGSGTATANGIDNQLTLGDNHGDNVIAAGISTLSSIALSKDLYLEVTVVSGGSTSVNNYSVSALDGFQATLRTSFSSTENTDGFYSDVKFAGTSSSTRVISYALRIRGEKLLIKGTTLPDTAAICAAAAAQAAAFNHRRVFYLFGDSVDVSIDGVVTNIPGYYVTAGLAGMIGSQDPQQPFTNLVMNGYSKVYGTEDTYSENQLDIIADGGRYVLKNLGGGISARHQRSTSNLTIEARELSITKAIDFLAKGLRQINRVFIGKFVITPGFLDQLTMANEGFLRRVVQQGVVRSSSLQSLLQSETAPDTVLIEVEVQPAYPCNKIRITIVS